MPCVTAAAYYPRFLYEFIYKYPVTLHQSSWHPSLSILEELSRKRLQPVCVKSFGVRIEQLGSIGISECVEPEKQDEEEEGTG